MKINTNDLKPILKPKNPRVIDPPRFPKLIIPLESEVKRNFMIQMSKLIVDVTKKMIDITK